MSGIRFYIKGSSHEKHEEIKNTCTKLRKKPQMKFVRLMGIKTKQKETKDETIFEFHLSGKHMIAAKRLTTEFEKMIKKLDSEATVSSILI